MKKRLVLFVLIIGLAGSVSAQAKVLKPTLQKSRSVPSAITLVYPNGGETIIQGSRQTIQWKVAGTSPVLHIKLLRNGKPVHTIAKNYSAAKRSFVWNVGNVQPGGRYTIQIIDVSGGLRAASKRPFSIVASAARAFGATQPRKLTPKPHASEVLETSGAKSKTADVKSLSPVKGEQSPAPGVPEPEQKVAKPWSKEYQRYGGESPPPTMRPFFGPEDSPQSWKSPDVTKDGEQSSPYQRQPEAKLPEQNGSWFDNPVDIPAKQENLPTTSMETELATFPDFEVERILFEPKIRRLHIEIANCGTKDHLDAPLELRWQLDNIGPEVISKDHWTLRKGEKKFWGITLDRRWHWPRGRGRLRCDVTADPNNNILEADEENNRHALWFYKTSGPDVNLATDHILIGKNEIVFTPGTILELGRSDTCDSNKERHIFAFDAKMQLVNYGDQAANGDLRVTTSGDYNNIYSTAKDISLQKGETRWFTIRQWMGVMPGGQSPFKVTWGYDKEILIEGDIQHIGDLEEWLGCHPELLLWIDREGPEGTRYNVDETIPVKVTVMNCGGSIQEGTICKVEMVKCSNSAEKEIVAQRRVSSSGPLEHDEKK